jgi:hypothetical protein
MADDTRQSTSPGFEEGDLAPRTVGFWAYGLLVIALSMAALVYLLWGGLQLLVRRPPVSSVEASRVVPPEPRLQTSPSDDLAKLLRRDRDRLGSTGWVDRDHGIAHIPIDRAMQMMAERGWPRPGGGGSSK